LGYTSQTSSIAPEYDLNSYLRGGEWHQLSGNRLAAATVEYRFFNSDSDFRPDCTAIFFDCGDILLPGESWDDLRMRYSYGISLIGELPIGNEFQIYLAVTDDKKCKLHCTLKYSLI
jgi:outer membrane protein assembly factor BamA